MRSRDLRFVAAVLAPVLVAGSQGAALAQAQPAPAPMATEVPHPGTAPPPAQAPPAATAPVTPPGYVPPPQQGYPPGYAPPPQQGYPSGYAPPPQQGYPPGYTPPPQGYPPGYFPAPQGGQGYPPQPYSPPPQGYPQGYYPPPPGYPPGYSPAPGHAPPAYYPPPPGYPPGYSAAPGHVPPAYYGPPQEYTGPQAVRARSVDVKAVVTGATTLGIAWSISSIAALVVMEEANGRSTGAEPLFVPVVGPFIAIGTMGAFDKDDGTQIGVLLILDGLAQTGGLLSVIFGALGRDTSASWADHPAAPEVRLGLGAAQLEWQF